MTTSPFVLRIASLHEVANSEFWFSLRNFAIANRSGVLTSAIPTRFAPVRHF